MEDCLELSEWGAPQNANTVAAFWGISLRFGERTTACAIKNRGLFCLPSLEKPNLSASSH